MMAGTRGRGDAETRREDGRWMIDDRGWRIGVRSVFIRVNSGLSLFAFFALFALAFSISGFARLV